MKQLFENKINKLRIMNFLYLLPVVLALIVYFINFWQANKALNIVADEGWAMFLMKDLPRGQVTQFFNIFQNVFDGNIFNIRLALIFMNFLGALFYSIGLIIFFKKIDNLKASDMLILISLSTLPLSLYIFSINYVSLNGFIQLSVIGFILIGLEKQTSKLSFIFLIMSGFFLGLHIFVMITNLPLIPITILFVFLLSNKELKYRNILLIGSGVFLSIMTYFMFFESFSVYGQSFIDLFNKTTSNNLDSSHGLNAMLVWVRKSALYFTMIIMVDVFFLFGVEKIKNELFPQTFRYILLIFAAIIIVKYLLSTLPTTPTTIFFVLSIYYLLKFNKESVESNKLKQIIVYLYIFIIPFFLSLGTDVPFQNRAVVYLGFIFPLIYLLILKIEHFRFNYLVLISFVFLFFINSIRGNINSYWNDIYLKKLNNVECIGVEQNLKLDTEKFQILVELKKIINDSDKVVIVDYHLWGYAYLLNTRPVSYSFWYDSNEISSKIRNNPSLYRNIKFMIRDDTKIWWGSTFNPKYLESVKNSLRAKKIIIHTFSIGKVYCFE